MIIIFFFISDWYIMRIRHFISATVIFPLLCFSAGLNHTVTLTETNGVSITGKITAYSSASGLVTILKETGYTKCPLSTLSNESRDQVMQWASDRNFQRRPMLSMNVQKTTSQSSSNVVGTITDSRTRTEREGAIGTETKTLCTSTFNLANHSDTPFEHLEADYRIFYTMPTHRYLGKYQLAGRYEIEILAPGSGVEFETTNFLCGIGYKAAPRVNWTGKPRSTGVNIEGVWMRLRKPGLSGEWIEREIEDGNVPHKRDRANYQKVYQ